MNENSENINKNTVIIEEKYIKGAPVVQKFSKKFGPLGGPGGGISHDFFLKNLFFEIKAQKG